MKKSDLISFMAERGFFFAGENTKVPELTFCKMSEHDEKPCALSVNYDTDEFTAVIFSDDKKNYKQAFGPILKFDSLMTANCML